MLSGSHGLFASLPPLHPVVFFEVLEGQFADLRSPLPEAEVTMPVLGDVQKFGVRRDLNYRFRRAARKVERGTPMPKPAELRKDLDEMQELVSKAGRGPRHLHALHRPGKAGSRRPRRKKKR